MVQRSCVSISWHSGSISGFDFPFSYTSSQSISWLGSCLSGGRSPNSQSHSSHSASVGSVVQWFSLPLYSDTVYSCFQAVQGISSSLKTSVFLLSLSIDRVVHSSTPIVHPLAQQSHSATRCFSLSCVSISGTVVTFLGLTFPSVTHLVNQSHGCGHASQCGTFQLSCSLPSPRKRWFSGSVSLGCGC